MGIGYEIFEAIAAGAAKAADPHDFTNKYNTKLTPDEEKEYQAWAKAEGRERDTYDYDLRGAWKELKSGTMSEDERGHLGDKYKKPNHPTFSTQSKYSSAETPGGVWSEENGRTVYTPSEFVRKGMGDENLKAYFSRFEPDVELRLGSKQ